MSGDMELLPGRQQDAGTDCCRFERQSVPTQCERGGGTQVRAADHIATNVVMKFGFVETPGVLSPTARGNAASTNWPAWPRITKLERGARQVFQRADAMEGLPEKAVAKLRDAAANE